MDPSPPRPCISLWMLVRPLVRSLDFTDSRWSRPCLWSQEPVKTRTSGRRYTPKQYKSKREKSRQNHTWSKRALKISAQIHNFLPFKRRPRISIRVRRSVGPSVGNAFVKSRELKHLDCRTSCATHFYFYERVCPSVGLSVKISETFISWISFIA